MLYRLPYALSHHLITDALAELPSDEFRVVINEPTGDFFYDEWKLKDSFKGTTWEIIYNSLPYPKGEARIIRLKGAESYISHADIDDRYHLNLTGDKCYLIDLDTDTLFPVKTDGTWYEMNAGRRHTASNFGNRDRLQLVVRKPLTRGKFAVGKDITITPKEHVDKDDARFLFDDVMSPWLNKINKEGLLNNFNFKDGVVTFTIDFWTFSKLERLLPSEFQMVSK